MFNPNDNRCKKCLIGIAYVKNRIGEDELKMNCRHKPKNLNQPDLFEQDIRFTRGWFIHQTEKQNGN